MLKLKMAQFLDESALKITVPFRMNITGASGVGKSHFVVRLIENENYLLATPTDSIIYFYNELNPTIKKLENNPKVTLKKGFDYDLILDNQPTHHLLCVIDDHINSEIYHHLSELFAVKSRALNISVCLLTQNIFSKGGNARQFNRDILINSTHTCIFENKRDKLSVMSIAKASFPTKYKYFMESYHSACDSFSDGHGYLFLSLSPQTNKQVELRTKIFFNEEVTILFWPR